MDFRSFWCAVLLCYPNRAPDGVPDKFPDPVSDTEPDPVPHALPNRAPDGQPNLFPNCVSDDQPDSISNTQLHTWSCSFRHQMQILPTGQILCCIQRQDLLLMPERQVHGNLPCKYMRGLPCWQICFRSGRCMDVHDLQ